MKKNALQFAAFALVAMACLRAPAQTHAMIEVGAEAPVIHLPDANGQAWSFDRVSTAPILLVFVKANDHYTSDAFSTIGQMLKDNPKLAENVKRWVVLSHAPENGQWKLANEPIPADWTVLLDEKMKAYVDYNIIATPTIFVIDGQREIFTAHAGYDTGIAQHLRLDLARLLGVTLPSAAIEKPPRPNMNLMIARRLAKRELWESALGYYQKAMAEEPLSDGVLCEVVEIYIQMDDTQNAEMTLDQISDPAAMKAEIDALQLRIDDIKQNGPTRRKPPKPI